MKHHNGAQVRFSRTNFAAKTRLCWGQQAIKDEQARWTAFGSEECNELSPMSLQAMHVAAINYLMCSESPLNSPSVLNTACSSSYPMAHFLSSFHWLSHNSMNPTHSRLSTSRLDRVCSALSLLNKFILTRNEICNNLLAHRIISVSRCLGWLMSLLLLPYIARPAYTCR